MPSSTLKESMNDWTEWDSAAHCLGVSLGLMSETPDSGRAKHVFWSNHPIGNLLSSMLDQMVAAGILEKRDEPDFQYRWNPLFRGSWE